MNIRIYEELSFQKHIFSLLETDTQMHADSI